MPTRIVETKEEVEPTKAISEMWFTIFGPMETLTQDETGMRGQHASEWAASNEIGLKFQAPRQKAHIVERHNKILRDGLHFTEAQLEKETIKAPLTVVLAQVTFMKNALTTIHESTAYHALLGRQPALLPPLEGTQHLCRTTCPDGETCTGSRLASVR